jgi:hypothetical protein
VNRQQDFGTIARSFIDSNQYMTLGTADEADDSGCRPCGVRYAAAD